MITNEAFACIMKVDPFSLIKARESIETFLDPFEGIKHVIDYNTGDVYVAAFVGSICGTFEEAKRMIMNFCQFFVDQLVRSTSTDELLTNYEELVNHIDMFGNGNKR